MEAIYLALLLISASNDISTTLFIAIWIAHNSEKTLLRCHIVKIVKT